MTTSRANMGAALAALAPAVWPAGVSDATGALGGPTASASASPETTDDILSIEDAEARVREYARGALDPQAATLSLPFLDKSQRARRLAQLRIVAEHQVALMQRGEEMTLAEQVLARGVLWLLGEEGVSP